MLDSIFVFDGLNFGLKIFNFVFEQSLFFGKSRLFGSFSGFDLLFHGDNFLIGILLELFELSSFMFEFILCEFQGIF